MLFRKIGKLLRGKATPFQVMLACLLGGAIGFMPSFVAAAGLIVVLTLAVIILNANLFLAAVVLAAAKLLSLAIMPVTFQVGRLLLDGPTQPVFKSMINAPVLALFGFEYYATTGGLLLGLIFGLVVGLLCNGALRSFRVKMSQLEEGSERYQRWSSKKWVKALAWMFFGGGHGKKTYAELTRKRVGNPVRPLGVVLALLVVALLVVARFFLTEPIVTAAMKGGLERANGATVDLDSAQLDLSEGRLTLAGLAMADANDLDRNVISAGRVEANISNADLLRKRMVIDRIELVDAVQGGERAVRGRIIGKRPTPAPPPKDEKTLEDYIEDAKTWKQRLAQVRRWLERLSPESKPADEAERPKKAPTLEERLRQRIRELGYDRVRAQHLLTGTPTLVVRKLIANGVPVRGLEGETIDIDGSNLSTQPTLLPEPPHVKVVSSKGTIEMDLRLTTNPATAEPGHVKLALNDLAAEKLAGSLPGARMRGGRLTFRTDGDWSGGRIDLPVTIQARNLEVALGGKQRTLDKLDFTVALVGPMDNPGVKLDEKALQQALLQAGAGKLFEKGAEKLKEKLGEDAGGALERGGGLLNRLRGGDDAEAER